MIIIVSIMVLAIVVDQLVKVWAQGALMGLPGGTMPVIPDVFHFTYVENRGAAFGMLQGKQILFFIITLVVVIGVLVYVIRNRTKLSTLAKVAIGLLLGGAIGNAIDRLMLGYVRDMFDFRLINFWVFNVADMCVVVATILLFILLFQNERKAKKETGKEKEA